MNTDKGATTMNNAEAIARCTGSVAATYITERVVDGKVVVESTETFTIDERDGWKRSGCCGESLTRPGHSGPWFCANCNAPQQLDMPRPIVEPLALPATEDMTLPELVREFGNARRRDGAVTSYATRATNEEHARFVAVVTALQRRGAL